MRVLSYVWEMVSDVWDLGNLFLDISAKRLAAWAKRLSRYLVSVLFGLVEMTCEGFKEHIRYLARITLSLYNLFPEFKEGLQGFDQGLSSIKIWFIKT